jgi:hypothetical protein
MGEEHAKRIPTELEIEILQHIADKDEGDRSRWLALINCALVCKAWTGYARGHLYYAIDMTFWRGNLQFGNLCEYTHLRPFLREFTWPQMTAMEWLYRYDARSASVLNDIAPTLTKFIFRTILHRHIDPRLKGAISAFTNINELDMTGSTFENWTTVVRVVSSFPFLTTLAMPRTFDDENGPDSPGGPEILYPPPSRLVHIKLAFGCETETVGWICTASPIPNIQTVQAESEVDANVLARLLRSLGRRLRHLIIHIGSDRAFLVLRSRRQNLF